MIVTKGYPKAILTQGYGLQGTVAYILELTMSVGASVVVSAFQRMTLDRLLSTEASYLTVGQRGYVLDIILRVLSSEARVKTMSVERVTVLLVGAVQDALSLGSSSPDFLFGASSGVVSSAGSAVSLNRLFQTTANDLRDLQHRMNNFLSMPVAANSLVSAGSLLKSLVVALRASGVWGTWDIWVRNQPRNPRSAVNDPAVGSFDWVNPQNIYYSDNVYSTFSGAGRQSRYLRGYNFSFDIPLNATINGIRVEYERKASVSNNPNNISDVWVRIYNNGWVGQNKAKTGRWGVNEGYAVYGANNDNWGIALTPADINSSQWGLGLSVRVAGSAVASVDSLRVWVYFTVYTGVSYNRFITHGVAGRMTPARTVRALGMRSLGVGAAVGLSSINRISGAVDLSVMSLLATSGFSMFRDAVLMVVQARESSLSGSHLLNLVSMVTEGTLMRTSFHESSAVLELKSSGALEVVKALEFMKGVLLRAQGIDEAGNTKGIQDFITLLVGAGVLSLDQDIEMNEALALSALALDPSRGGAVFDNAISLLTQVLTDESGFIDLYFTAALAVVTEMTRSAATEISTALAFISAADALEEAAGNFSDLVDLSVVAEEFQSAGFKIMAEVELIVSALKDRSADQNMIVETKLNAQSEVVQLSQGLLGSVVVLEVLVLKLREVYLEFDKTLSLDVGGEMLMEREPGLFGDVSLTASAGKMEELTLEFLDFVREILQADSSMLAIAELLAAMTMRLDADMLSRFIILQLRTIRALYKLKTVRALYQLALIRSNYALSTQRYMYEVSMVRQIVGLETISSIYLLPAE